MGVAQPSQTICDDTLSERTLINMEVAPKTSVSFTLNGRRVQVEGASSLLSLNDWLRVQPGLTGTKKMCNEGGCGCCVVAGALEESKGQCPTIAINSVSKIFVIE